MTAIRCVTDIITNEMEGNGSTAGAYDVGNLLLINLRHFLYPDLVFKNGFESP